MSWNIKKLYQLADLESEAFANPKLARAYAAMARYDLLVVEPRPDEQTLKQELADALAALDENAVQSAVANPLLTRLVAEISKHVPVEAPVQTDADEEQGMGSEPSV